MNKTKFYIFGIVLLCFSACDIINPPEDIPAYVHLKEFNVMTTNQQGTSASKITDAWVYANGDFIGVYDLPATFPVLTDGETELVIDAGIKENGIRATPDVYPFYERYTLNRDLTPAVIDTITPQTSYNSDAKFAYVQDFETGAVTLYDADEDSLTTVNFNFPSGFEGKSAQFEATPDVPAVEVATTQKIQLPTDGSRTFLELNYKNDSELLVGLIGFEQNSENPLKFIKITLTPQTSWNKIYINFTDDLVASDLFEYQIFFVGVLPEGSDKATFFIDNIKLVHF